VGSRRFPVVRNMLDGVLETKISNISGFLRREEGQYICWSWWSKYIIALLIYKIVKYHASGVVCTTAPADMLSIIITSYDKIMSKGAKIISVALYV